MGEGREKERERDNLCDMTLFHVRHDSFSREMTDSHVTRCIYLRGKIACDVIHSHLSHVYVSVFLCISHIVSHFVSYSQ